MGLFDALLGAVKGARKCPLCGAPGGQTGAGGVFRCPNPICLNFDPTLTGGQSVAPLGRTTPAAAPMPPPGADAAPIPSAASSAGPTPAGTVAIAYRNFQGADKRFIADVASLRRTKEHIFARVAPRGVGITLARKRITNLDEVERQMPARVAPNQAWPTPRERQVLGYHKKHHTTSALYEKIRAKYPNW
jgi:hypothetical protein